MRYIIHKRRLFARLLVLLIFVLVIFFYTTIEEQLLFHDLKEYIKVKAEDVLGVKIRYGSVEGGFIGNIVIRDFRICRDFKSEPIAEVEKIIIDYKILDRIRYFKEHPKSLFLLWKMGPSARLEMLLGEKGIGSIYLISPCVYIRNLGLQRYMGKLESGGPANIAKIYPKPISFIVIDGAIAAKKSQGAPLIKGLKGRVLMQEDEIVIKELRGLANKSSIDIRGDLYNLAERPSTLMNISLEDEKLSVNLSTDGPIDDFAVIGSVNLLKSRTFDLNARVTTTGEEGIVRVSNLSIGTDYLVDIKFDLNKNGGTFSVSPKEGKIQGDFLLGDTYLSLNGRAEHAKIAGFDLIGDFNSVIARKTGAGEGAALRCDAKITDVMLNYIAFSDIRLFCMLEDDTLEILSFEIGENFRLHGKALLEAPYDLDLEVAINNMDLAKIAELQRGNNAPADIMGTLNGSLKMTGPFENAVTKGRFEVTNGRLGDVVFNYGVANIKGKGPVLTLEDSKIHKDAGFLLVNGTINMRDIGKRNIFENVIVETDQKVVIWEGWEVTKPADGHVINASKELGRDFRVNFQTFTGSKNPDETQKTSHVELEHKMTETDSLKMRLKDNDEFFGVEHKIKF